jgi:regulatory protein
MDKKPDSDIPGTRRARKQPRKLSARYLENAALYYLQRYATSTENFRRVMRRKIDRSCAFHQTRPDEFYTVIEDLIKRYISAGLLNDRVFSDAKVSSLRRQGRSKRDIMARLQNKGLKPAEIETALAARDAEVEEDDAEGTPAELQAARRLARRKKLGVYNPNPPADPKAKQKEMAALARAGFSYEICRLALETGPDDDMNDGDF